MDAVVCQYCNAEVSMIEVEKESGLCPECGAMLDGSQIWDGGDDDDDDFEDEEDIQEELDDDDLDDFDDLDDDEDDDNY